MRITEENIKTGKEYFKVCCGEISRIKVIKLGHTHTFVDLNRTSPLYDYISLDYDPEYVFENHFVSDATRGLLNQMFTTREEAEDLINLEAYKIKLKEHNLSCEQLNLWDDWCSLNAQEDQWY